MKIEILAKMADRTEVDYPFLVSALKAYARPRDKISEWLKSGALIRVKKGLYVFNEDVVQRPYSLEILANLIYGPSAISLTYALSFYGLIPERVTVVTSITNKRYKTFATPIGHFAYYLLPSKKYSIGIGIETISSNRQFLIASPEKALCDQIYIMEKRLEFDDLEDVESYLFQDLRIDMDALKIIDIKKLSEICKIYQSKKLKKLNEFLRKWKSRHA